jgi:hypothetical protein
MPTEIRRTNRTYGRTSMFQVRYKDPIQAMKTNKQISKYAQHIFDARLT